ncbi:MAG: hypothetical protein QM775_03120 [Pirellulales bacterium]
MYRPLAACAAAVAMLCTAASSAADAPAALRIENAVATLVEQVELPAHSAGPLAELKVREGNTVRAGNSSARSTTKRPAWPCGGPRPI